MGLKKRAGLCTALLASLFVTLVILCGGCAANRVREPLSETRLLLDTVCTVTLYSPLDREILAEALELCAEYEAQFSRTVEGGDIWRINHSDGAPVTVCENTAALIKSGLEYGAFSEGRFDITIGRVSELWDFSNNPSVPEEGALEEALGTVNYSSVAIDGNTVTLNNPGTQLDLGGIAKGYIADRLSEFLKERGVESAIINLGGNILTVGEKPDGRLWRIGVEEPYSGHSGLLGDLTVGEASVVTSGIYERQFSENGVTYHHILDPRTGRPAESDVVSATVVTRNSMLGDVMSTIIVLAGSGEADELLKKTPEAQGAVLLLKSGEILELGNVEFSTQYAAPANAAPD